MVAGSIQAVRGWWKRQAGPFKTWIVCWSLAAVVFCGGVVGLIAEPGPVTPQSLYSSVQSASPYEDFETKDARCLRLSPHIWRCGIATDDSGKATVFYTVVTSGSDWAAARIGHDHSTPESMSDYVGAGDAGGDSVLILLLGLTWLLLVFAPLFVWLTVRFREKQPVEKGAPRPVSRTPERPGS